jgi:hypothetical protein
MVLDIISITILQNLISVLKYPRVVLKCMAYTVQMTLKSTDFDSAQEGIVNNFHKSRKTHRGYFL